MARRAPYLWDVDLSTRPARVLAMLLVAALFSLSAIPAEASAAASRRDCCGHLCPASQCPTPDATLGVPSVVACCALAPASPHPSALTPPATVPPQAVVSEVSEVVPSRPVAHARPHDTGPPPLGRRHLALSVLQV